MKSQETREIPFGMRDRLGYMFGDLISFRMKIDKRL